MLSHWNSEHPARYGMLIRVTRHRVVLDWQFGHHKGIVAFPVWKM